MRRAPLALTLALLAGCGAAPVRPFDPAAAGLAGPDETPVAWWFEYREGERRVARADRSAPGERMGAARAAAGRALKGVFQREHDYTDDTFASASAREPVRLQVRVRLRDPLLSAPTVTITIAASRPGSPDAGVALERSLELEDPTPSALHEALLLAFEDRGLARELVGWVESSRPSGGDREPAPAPRPAPTSTTERAMPTLRVLHPQEGDVLETATVTVWVEAGGEGRFELVRIDGHPARAEGASFGATVTLVPGPNVITAEGRTAAGDVVTARVRVQRAAPR